MRAAILLVGGAALCRQVHGQASPCLPVHGETIMLSDFQWSSAAIGGVDPRTRFGYSPAPGSTRVAPLREIRAFLKKEGIVASAETLRAVCFERIARTLSKDDFLRAIRRTFGAREIEIELLEISKTFAPLDGELTFDLNTLPRSNNVETPIIWRGTYRDGHGSSVPVWARVRLKEQGCQAIARTDLTPAMPITSDSVDVRKTQVFPGALSKDDCDVNFSGRRVRRVVRQGEALHSRYLEDPFLVVRGQDIAVEVDTGRARIVVPGKAISSAKVGQRAAFTTGLSKRQYMGTVNSRGHIEVGLRD